MVTTEISYNVECMDCGQVFTTEVKTPLWWRAKKCAEGGRLDALHIHGKDCGCVKSQTHPEAPFRVFGYDDMCMDYDIPCDTFIAAVKTYLRRSRRGDVTFIIGVSKVVQDKLKYS